ncbi:YfiT family bacillithiol transferase [Deinococcus altitudinis]|uniref:YfiT family bacillithiol transferase n=1 Tax=Deinococcus altitudinis TaxID=468914 RepID=UPI0038919AAC
MSDLQTSGKQSPEQQPERFPIGPQPQVSVLSPDERRRLLASLAELPAQFRAAFAGLDDAQLNTPYREGGWALRQVAHHVPDSHMNAYIRTRLALSEEAPTIRPYDQNAWAALPDMDGDIAVSLDLLGALHGRWARLLSALSEEQWAATFVHPEYGRVYTLDGMLASYVWHGQHHAAQVTGLRERKGW